MLHNAQNISAYDSWNVPKLTQPHARLIMCSAYHKVVRAIISGLVKFQSDSGIIGLKPRLSIRFGCIPSTRHRLSTRWPISDLVHLKAAIWLAGQALQFAGIGDLTSGHTFIQSMAEYLDRIIRGFDKSTDGWKVNAMLDLRKNEICRYSLTRPNEFGSMTARKGDTKPWKAIKRSYKTTKRPHKTLKGHTRPQ